MDYICFWDDLSRFLMDLRGFHFHCIKKMVINPSSKIETVIDFQRPLIEYYIILATFLDTNLNNFHLGSFKEATKLFQLLQSIYRKNTFHIVFSNVRPEHYSHMDAQTSCGFISRYNLNYFKSGNLKINEILLGEKRYTSCITL